MATVDSAPPFPWWDKGRISPGADAQSASAPQAPVKAGRMHGRPHRGSPCTVRAAGVRHVVYRRRAAEPCRRVASGQNARPKRTRARRMDPYCPAPALSEGARRGGYRTGVRLARSLRGLSDACSTTPPRVPEGRATVRRSWPTPCRQPSTAAKRQGAQAASSSTRRKP